MTVEHILKIVREIKASKAIAFSKFITMNTKAIRVSDEPLILVSILSSLYFLLATPNRPSTAFRIASSWRWISFCSFHNIISFGGLPKQGALILIPCFLQYFRFTLFR
jgi:hypothetical protein